VDPAGGELAYSQVGEVTALHKPVRPRLNNLLDN